MIEESSCFPVQSPYRAHMAYACPRLARSRDSARTSRALCNACDETKADLAAIALKNGTPLSCRVEHASAANPNDQDPPCQLSLTCNCSSPNISAQ
jgi:hypothetical protein